MLRWIILAVIVVGLSAAVPVLLANLPTDSEGGLVLARASSERKGPVGKLYVEGDPTHDFGTLSNWATGEKEWTVKNVGQGDLELTMGGLWEVTVELTCDGEPDAALFAICAES